MDVRRRHAELVEAPLKPNKLHHAGKVAPPVPAAFHLTNASSVVVFFSAVYYLLSRWREKIRTGAPLHFVAPSEMVAIASLVGSFVWFFGFDFVQSLILRPSLETWTDDETEKAEEDIVVPLKPKMVEPIPEEKVIGTVNITSAEDEEIINSVVAGITPSYSLESKLGDCRRAAGIRRETLQRATGRSLEGLPLDGFDYQSILGQCCEMPVGYVQIPVGIVGPLKLDGVEYTVPMATTEGTLVASTNRGCKAIAMSGGATSVILRDGMTRAPVVRFGTVTRAADLKFFLESPANFDAISAVFNSSSRFGRLQDIKCAIAGKNLYMRFSCSTGDAMGMNMVSKGVQNVLDFLHKDFPDMEVMGISGNFCSDKKPAAVNWIEGRGKSVVCEAILKGDVVRKILKTSVEVLVELNVLKNLTGSAMAGALGGFNAHASNILTAIYIATGQDPAQNVESSHCLTMMEAVNEGQDLHVSVSMPCIEVGTVGGGTQLASQSACLNLLGVKGANKKTPGDNSRQLARIVAGSVLAGEISLMSALAAGHLVKSHMKYNRSSKDVLKVASS
ncbi:hypothetical protein SAY86_004029 [Trapa natans]|uniref:3-hydroxy-3-methylglutaryl coenzyme A reductase n=1 Tax=Trapa natans TaxID=22666 RepID=A0AAN7RHK1_TRANT|nr:hypothetical protein SAY86_004029 [Trapa natans]